MPSFSCLPKRHAASFGAVMFGLLVCVNADASSVPAHIESLLDDRTDQVLQRTYVPSPEQRVGEVRLIRRGSANVVQTLLYSKILKRVVGEIRKKEESNWRPGADGHGDAVRYLAALERAQEEIWQSVPKAERVADRRQKLMIEFILTEKVAAVVMSTFEMDEVDGEVRIRARKVLDAFEPSRAYVKRNMRLIVADSFALPAEQLSAFLEPLELIRNE